MDWKLLRMVVFVYSMIFLFLVIVFVIPALITVWLSINISWWFMLLPIPYAFTLAITKTYLEEVKQ